MFSPQRITRVTAIALAAGAIGAPVALAQPANSEPSAGVAAGANSLAQAHQLKVGKYQPFYRNVSAARLAADLAGPLKYARQDKQLVPSSSPQSPVNTAPPSARASTASSAFDWGDAGIGAAGGLAISIVGIGGVLALSQRRTRRTGAPAVIAG